MTETRRRPGLEQSYHEEDEHGIKLAAYAFHGVEQGRYGDIGALAEVASTSSLNRFTDPSVGGEEVGIIPWKSR
jgi:hypothetical protein